MKIILKINGKDKTFNPPSFIPSRRALEAAQLEDKYLMGKPVDEDVTQEGVVDILIDFVVSVYDHQFTKDEFYDGMDARDLFRTIGQVFRYITTGTIDAVTGGKKRPNK